MESRIHLGFNCPPSVTAKPCSFIRNHYLSPPLPIIIIIFHKQPPLGRYHSHNHHPLQLGSMMAIQVTELTSVLCFSSTLYSDHPFHSTMHCQRSSFTFISALPYINDNSVDALSNHKCISMHSVALKVHHCYPRHVECD